jgi:hypothetical protein
MSAVRFEKNVIPFPAVDGREKYKESLFPEIQTHHR